MLQFIVFFASACTLVSSFSVQKPLLHHRLCEQDLASGYMSGKLLQKLEAVHFMLQHHTSDHFGFLEDHTRNRTIFYHTLSRLLFMDDTPSNFKAFVAPLQQVMLVRFGLYTVCNVVTQCNIILWQLKITNDYSG